MRTSSARIVFAAALILAASVTTTDAFSAAATSSRATTTTTSLHAETSSELLGLPARPGRPLKVAIAGGGVGGLTAALCCLKKGMDVTIYEKTQAFARFGGPIQFASNALSTLKEIDESVFERVMEKFTFTGTRVCGIKDGLRADGTFRMTDDSWDFLVNKDAPPDWFVKFPLKQCADLFGLPYTGVIDRPDLQEILLDECKKRDTGFIENGNAVVGYENLPDGQGVTIQLQDGSTAQADVLIGADGIWSNVRGQMYKEDRANIEGASVRQGCPYSGYTVFAGETIMRKPDYYDTGYVVYIGPKRYFVTSDVGNGRIQWYAFFALPPGTKKASSGWGGSEEKVSDENLVEYIKGLHEGWTDEVMQVLDATPPESVEQRDLYDRRPELLRSWADGNVVLMGDAVHAMMPNLGQGGCQAIEDAYVLSELLANTKSTDKLPSTLQTFYNKRLFRVSMVQFMSKLASDLIINAFDTPWSPHDNLGKSWKSYLTFFWKPILQYLIFPAQFAYLYSYHPTGNIAETAKALAETWEGRHRESAEAAFSRVEGGEQVKASGPSFFQKIKDNDKAEEKPVVV